MKNLLLILVLSFLSIQSFAAGCPDGSEPVKSISADGTYFVYNCAGGNEQSSSSTANSSNVNSNTKALAGIDIENDPNIDFFKPPMAPYPTDMNYWFGRQWRIAVFSRHTNLPIFDYKLCGADIFFAIIWFGSYYESISPIK